MLFTPSVAFLWSSARTLRPELADGELVGGTLYLPEGSTAAIAALLAEAKALRAVPPANVVPLPH
jgi:hypothetical protein